MKHTANSESGMTAAAVSDPEGTLTTLVLAFEIVCSTGSALEVAFCGRFC